MIVANNPHETGAAFAHDTNVVKIYGPGGLLYESGGPEPKLEIARRILFLASQQEAFKKIPV